MAECLTNIWLKIQEKYIIHWHELNTWVKQYDSVSVFAQSLGQSSTALSKFALVSLQKGRTVRLRTGEQEGWASGESSTEYNCRHMTEIKGLHCKTSILAPAYYCYCTTKEESRKTLSSRPASTRLSCEPAWAPKWELTWKEGRKEGSEGREEGGNADMLGQRVQ